MVLKVALGAAAVVILAVAIFAGRPHFKRYRVPSASMLPTIEEGDTVNLNGGEDLRVGDIVILNPPQGAVELNGPQCGSRQPGDQPCAKAKGGRAREKFVKRIVAGPGDRIAFDRGRVVLNGRRQDEPYAADCGDGPDCDFPTPITVPDGTFYLVGDNRGASDDSRFWGPVPEEWILGRVERCEAIYFFCSPA